MKMNEFLGQFGMTRSDVENWSSRLTLRTKYQPTVSGRAREFSADNVLELAMINALVKGGCKPPQAVTLSEIVTDNYSYHCMKIAKQYLIIESADFGRAHETNDLTSVSALLAESKTTHAALIIDVWAIVDKVNQLFPHRAGEQ